MEMKEQISGNGLTLLTGEEELSIQGGIWKEVFFFLLSEFDDITRGFGDGSSGRPYNH